MAYIEPKTNWVASNIPVASDLNRIEGNTKQNHDDIAAETIARAADVDAEEAARIADVNAEEAARIAQIAGLMVLDSVGSLALCRASSAVAPGGTVSGSSLKYATVGGDIASSPVPSGTWRCMGYSIGGGSPTGYTTLFQRIL